MTGVRDRERSSVFAEGAHRPDHRAGRNLGKSIALTLGDAGARVICAYERDGDAAAATAGEITDKGGSAGTVRINLADVPSLQAQVAGLLAAGEQIDILVNNAAIRPRTPIAGVTVEEWDMVHAINLRGPFFLSQAVLPHMISQRWGRIINIGGLDAYRGTHHRPHNVAAKLGMVGLARALANETAINGVTVNTVVPGIMHTPRYHPEWSPNMEAAWTESKKLIPMGRLGAADDIGNACLFLASEEANYITGQELLVTGGAHPLVRFMSAEEKAATDDEAEA